MTWGPTAAWLGPGYGTDPIWRLTGGCGSRLASSGYGTHLVRQPTGDCPSSLFELRRGLAEALAEAGARAEGALISGLGPHPQAFTLRRLRDCAWAEGSHQGLRSCIQELRFSRASSLDSRPI